MARPPKENTLSSHLAAVGFCGFQISPWYSCGPSMSSLTPSAAGGCLREQTSVRRQMSESFEGGLYSRATSY